MKQKLGLLVLKYLRFWAKIQLKKISPDIIGITGSAGKTSCRNAVAAILKDKYRVKVSLKANSESGIPLNILGIKPKNYSPVDWLRMMILAPLKVLTNWERYEKYIAEMGIDSPKPPKNMAYLLTILKPRTGILLNALPVHTAFYPSENPIAAIAKEKGKLIESLPVTGLAILNADDAKVMASAPKTKAQTLTFGKKGQVKLTVWQITSQGTKFGFTFAEQKGELVLPYYLPEHFGYSLAAALAVGIDEDLILSEGCELLKRNFKLPPSRSSVFVGVNNSIIIDSSYNASPPTMKDMLELLAKVPGKRKLALLGDMRELGAEIDKEHEMVIQQALKTADEVYLVGQKMRQNMVSPAIWCENAQQAAEVIKPKLGPGDVLLVKGSQNTIFLETAVAELLADPKDQTKLCRRGEFWEKQRNLLGGRKVN